MTASRYLSQQWRNGTRPELFSVAYGPDYRLSDDPGQPSPDRLVNVSRTKLGTVNYDSRGAFAR